MYLNVKFEIDLCVSYFRSIVITRYFSVKNGDVGTHFNKIPLLFYRAVQLRPLRYDDFKNAMTVIRPSLQKIKWDELEKWNEEFGSS
jgi:hypothetical protein